MSSCYIFMLNAMWEIALICFLAIGGSKGEGIRGLHYPVKKKLKQNKHKKEKKSLYLLCFPRLQLTITPNLTTSPPPFFLKRKKKSGSTPVACYKMATLEVLDKSWFYTRNGDWLHSKRDTMPSNDQQECINVNTHTSLKSLFAI